MAMCVVMASVNGFYRVVNGFYGTGLARLHAVNEWLLCVNEFCEPSLCEWRLL